MNRTKQTETQEASPVPVRPWPMSGGTAAACGFALWLFRPGTEEKPVSNARVISLLTKRCSFKSILETPERSSPALTAGLPVPCVSPYVRLLGGSVFHLEVMILFCVRLSPKCSCHLRKHKTMETYHQNTSFPWKPYKSQTGLDVQIVLKRPLFSFQPFFFHYSVGCSEHYSLACNLLSQKLSTSENKSNIKTVTFVRETKFGFMAANNWLCLSKDLHV